MNLKNMGSCLTLFTCLVGTANASTYTGKVFQILTGIQYGSNVIIKVDGNPVQNGCHTNPNYHYVFDGTSNTGKMMLSSIYIAYSAQKEVALYGASNCNLFNGIEDLNQVLLQ